MSKVQTASERITEEVTSWPGVTAGPGRRGEFAFKVGGREIDPRRHRSAAPQLRPRSDALTSPCRRVSFGGDGRERRESPLPADE